MIDCAEYEIEEPEIMLFLITELVSSTCYSAILYEEPANIETIKPYLFTTIRVIIRQDETAPKAQAEMHYHYPLKKAPEENDMSFSAGASFF